MTIKTKLYLSATVSSILICILVILLLSRYTEIQFELEKKKVADDLVEETTDLILLTEKYFSYRYIGTENQWELKYQAIVKLQRKLHMHDDMDVAFNHLDLLHKSFTRLKRENLRKKDTSRNNISAEDIDRSMMLEDRLVGQMRLSSHGIMTNAFNTSKYAYRKVSAVLQRNTATILIISFFLMAAVIVTSYFIVTSIAKPIQKLVDGVNHFGKGHLDHRIEIMSKDETGIFSQAFNKMADQLQCDIIERRRAEKVLKLSEEKFRGVYEQSPIAVEIYDKDGKLIDVNQTALDMFGVSDKEHVLGFNLWADPNISEKKKEQLKSGQAVYVSAVFDFEFVKSKNLYPTTRSGKIYWDLYALPLMGETVINGYLVQIIEVTKRKQAEEQINASLKEKDILLQEIHHRVKNNMQVIASLLNLQSSSIDDDRVKNVLKESHGRIYAMSAIHEVLHNSESLSEIDLKSYLTMLGRALIQTYTIDPGEVNLHIDCAEINISINKANPLGLTINELISNSLKYAFSENKDNQIDIIAKVIDENDLEIIVNDNGVGMPKDFDWRKTDTLGLQLVRDLIEKQLKGAVIMESKNGTKFTIIINIET
jgi:PAS domain S-box-containing protein